MIGAEPPLCPACGTVLTEDSPEGLCAKCVVKVLLDFDSLDLDEALAEEAPLGEMGDYEILGKIAAGGMGVVYRARQKRLNRLVALKLVTEGKLASRTDQERFLLEAQAAGELDHPNIVPVYEVGQHEGQYYFTMRLVTGGSLTDHFEREMIRQPEGFGESSVSAGFRERQVSSVRLLVKVARAVHYAHGEGIIHRDLKPSNILIDHRGEPQISDFGLAKRLHEDTNLTISGQVLGSPAYMAPEQARGERDVTPAADIYALGVILYQYLTGRVPFEADTPMGVIQQTLTKEPKRPRLLNPRADRDLQTVCLRCLEKEPVRRYASAAALADDLQCWLDGRPILAKPVGVGRRVMKWTRRQPALAALILLGLLSSLVVAGLLSRQAQTAARNEQDSYTRDLSTADEFIRSARFAEAAALLEAYQPNQNGVDRRGFAWHRLWHACQDQALIKSITLPAEHFAVHLARDEGNPGRLLMQANDGALWETQMSDTQAATMAALPKVTLKPGKPRFSGGGTFLLNHADDEGQGIWIVGVDGRKLRVPRGIEQEEPEFLSAGPDKPLGVLLSIKAVADGKGGRLRLWRPTERVPMTKDLGRMPSALAISPRSARSGRLYVAMAYWESITIWALDGEVFSQERTFEKPAGDVTAMAFSPNGRLLAMGDPAGQVRVVERESGGETVKRELGKAVLAVTWLQDPEGAYAIAASDETGGVKIWDVLDPLGRRVFNKLFDTRLPVAFEGERLGAFFIGNSAGSGILRMEAGRAVAVASFPREGELLGLRYQEGDLVAVRSEGKAVKAYRIPPDGGIDSIVDLSEPIRTDAIMAQRFVDGHWLVLTSEGLKRWDLASGRLLGKDPLQLPRGETIRCATFDPFEPNLFVVSTSGRVWLGDLSGHVLDKPVLDLGASPVRCVAKDPFEETLATVQADGVIRLWHLPTGKALLPLESTNPWRSLVFFPDGRGLLAAAENGDVFAWRVPVVSP